MSNLNLLESGSKMSKSTNVVGESHCNRWLDIDESLAFLIRSFNRSSHVFRSSSKKMWESFPIISNLAVTTRIAVDYSIEDLFLKGIFESKQVTKSASGSKNIIKLRKCYIFLNRASQMFFD